MEKDIFITIKSTHMIDEESDDIELILPGCYAYKDGKHRIEYEEPVEGAREKIKNTLIIGEAGMELVKEGLVNTRMLFLKSGEKTSSVYSTRFGDITTGIKTFAFDVKESGERICVNTEYSLEMGGEYISTCNLKMDIRSKSSANIHL